MNAMTTPNDQLDAPPLLDPAIVASLRMLKLVGRLYPAFIAALPGHLAGVQRAIAADDRPALRMLVHMLRGSSSQLGATALARAFGVIEEAIVYDDGRPWPSAAELDAVAQATTAAMAREAQTP